MSMEADEASVLGLSQCIFCGNYLGAGVCRAYTGDPFKIPVIILANSHDHSTEYPGDRGIRFEPKNAEAQRIHSDQMTYASLPERLREV